MGCQYIILISDVYRKLDDNLLCRCEGHKTQRCSEMCTKVRQEADNDNMTPDIMVTWGRQTGGGRSMPARPGGAGTGPSRDPWPGNMSPSLLLMLTMMCAGGQQRAPGSGGWTVDTRGTGWPAGRSGRGTWGPSTGSGTSSGPSREFESISGKSLNVSSFVPILTLPNWVPDSI